MVYKDIKIWGFRVGWNILWTLKLFFPPWGFPKTHSLRDWTISMKRNTFHTFFFFFHNNFYTKWNVLMPRFPNCNKRRKGCFFFFLWHHFCFIGSDKIEMRFISSILSVFWKNIYSLCTVSNGNLLVLLLLD